MQDTSCNTAMDAKLPSFLFEPFKQYKRDTAHLASWLGATAQSLGFNHHGPQFPAASTAADTGASLAAKPGRLKGKARKAAKASAPLPNRQAPASTSADSSTGKTTMLSTSQFVQLAQFIVDFDNPPIVVPPRILAWATSAIQARRKCAAWFQSATNGPDTAPVPHGAGDSSTAEARNKTHEYFIGILDSVISILGPRVGERQIKGKGKAKMRRKADRVHGQAGVDMVESRFSALSLEVAAGRDSDSDNDSQDDWEMVDQLVQEAVGGATTPARSKQHGNGGKIKEHDGPRRIRNKYVLEDDDWDAFFVAYVGFLNDLWEVRQKIARMWQSYHLNATPSLSVAALVSSALVEMVEATHKTLKEKFPTFMASEDQVREGVFRVAVQTIQQMLDEVASGELELPPNRKIPTVDEASSKWADATLLSAHNTLQLLLFAFLKLRDVEVHVQGLAWPISSSSFNPLVAEWKQTNQDQLIEEFHLLGRLLVARDMINMELPQFLPPIPILHDIESLANSDILNDTLVRPSTSFTAQIYTDATTFGLRSGMPEGSRALEQIRSCIKPLITAFILYVRHDPQATFYSPDANHDELALELFNAKVPWWPDSHPDDRESLEILIMSHLWWAGLLVGSAQNMVREFAWAASDNNPAMFLAAYLYVAVDLGMQACGLIPKSASAKPTLGWWPHMDQLIEIVGLSRLFYGREPSTVGDLWKSFMLELGVSGVDLALVQGSTTGLGSLKPRRRTDREPFRLQPLLDASFPSSIPVYTLHRFTMGVSHPALAKASANLYAQFGNKFVDGLTRYFDSDRGPPTRTSDSRQHQSSLSNKNKTSKLHSTFSSFFSVLYVELAESEKLASHNTLLLHTQACRLVSFLNVAVIPRLASVVAVDREPCGMPGTRTGLVWTLISSLVDVDGSDPASLYARSISIAHSQDKREVLKDCLVLLREGLEEILDDDSKGPFAFDGVEPKVE